MYCATLKKELAYIIIIVLHSVKYDKSIKLFKFGICGITIWDNKSKNWRVACEIALDLVKQWNTMKQCLEQTMFFSTLVKMPTMHFSSYHISQLFLWRDIKNKKNLIRVKWGYIETQFKRFSFYFLWWF